MAKRGLIVFHVRQTQKFNRFRIGWVDLRSRLKENILTTYALFGIQGQKKTFPRKGPVCKQLRTSKLRQYNVKRHFWGRNLSYISKHGKNLIIGFRGHWPHKKWGFNFLARLKEFQTRYFIYRHDPRTSHQIIKSFKTTRLLCVDPWHEIGLSSSSFIIINYCLRKSLRHLF